MSGRGRAVLRDQAVGGGTVAGDDAWYEELRRQYRPTVVRVILIGESPPDPHDAERRYFYAPKLSQHDNLYRGVSMAFYGDSAAFDVKAKLDNLERLQDDGVWLIDAVPYPINAATRSDRRRAIRDNVDGLVSQCIALRPTLGVIVCHGKVYVETAEPLRRAGVHVMHDLALPFPLGNTRAAFVNGARAALTNAGWSGAIRRVRDNG